MTFLWEAGISLSGAPFVVGEGMDKLLAFVTDLVTLRPL